MKIKRNQTRFRIWLLDLFSGALLLYLYAFFFKQCSIEGVEGLIGLFVVLLWKYVFEKTKSKKQQNHTRKRKGEAWIFVWIVSCYFMIFVNHLFPENFNLPKNEIVFLLTSICGLGFFGKIES